MLPLLISSYSSKKGGGGGDLGQFADLREEGGLAKKWEVDTPMHTME